MYYEINVSYQAGTININGKLQPRFEHLFATAPRSLQTKKEMLVLLNLFVYKFPIGEGYKIDVTCYEEVGDILNVDDLLKELE